MDRKKIIVTIWLATLVLAPLFFFLSSKADRYFLSNRVLSNEKISLQNQSFEKRKGFDLFRSPADDERLIKMLEDRMHEDQRIFFILLAIIFVILNIAACLLYVFNMKPVSIVTLMLFYVLIGVFLVMQSLIRINPH